MNNLKNFCRFVNENSKAELEALRDLLNAKQEIALAADELAVEFGIDLEETCNSWQEGNPDPKFGNWISYSPNEPVDGIEDLQVIIYEGQLVQFAYDSIFYPTRHHTRMQGAAMMRDDTPFPLPWSRLNQVNWKEFIAHVQEGM
jgi:hypothetical protein